MTDAITREITGEAVSVSIAGRSCALSYPMHNLLVFKRLTGLSLFARESWDKLDFESDYDAWMACLWAGLHELGADGSWSAPYSKAQLELLINLGNAADIHNAMFRALTAWMPKKKETKQVDGDAAPAEKKTETIAITTTPPGSGSAPNADSVLVASNS